jgi:hypothetical protein
MSSGRMVSTETPPIDKGVFPSGLAKVSELAMNHPLCVQEASAASRLSRAKYLHASGGTGFGLIGMKAVGVFL